MIQTTLFNYFIYNKEQLQQSKNKPSLSFRQTNLTNYFQIIPKKKNLILNYFKPKEEKVKNKAFDIVLVDIQNSWKYAEITCIKKNMYEEDLKYIAISYRWGEVDEQLVKTPDYTAHITSFAIADLITFCYSIKNQPDLKEIQYLWIDAISVDQQNHSRKIDTMLKMNQIYQKAAYILAVPDLHYSYLNKNTANREIMDMIWKHKSIIHLAINPSLNTNPIRHYTENTSSYSMLRTNNHHQSVIQKLKDNNNNNSNTINDVEVELRRRIEELEIKMKENELKTEREELKKAFQFLAYLTDDWSNRVWVISEYQIAKEKYIKHGTPLKFIFLSLLCNNEVVTFKNFFSYTFDVDQLNSNETNINYFEVDNSNKFIHFLKSKFMQRSYLDMILKSKASKNKDRFYAILPIWNKKKHLIKDKTTVSNWKIMNMLSVKLKLYEIMDDLRDKTRLLFTDSIYMMGKPILPSFATYYDPMPIAEIDTVHHAHKLLLEYLSKLKIDTSKIYNKSINNEYLIDYEKEHGSIFKQNLVDIQFNQQQCYLSVKANNYFIFNIPPSSSSSNILDQEELSNFLKDNDNDKLKLIYIPFFTYDMPEFAHLLPLDKYNFPILSGTFLLGNLNINRWILYELRTFKKIEEPTLCSNDVDYIFNIY